MLNAIVENKMMTYVKTIIQTLTAIFLIGLLAQPTFAANMNWSFPAKFTKSGSVTTGIYHPIPTKDITKHWHICALFPHMKDSYWLAADYGIFAEAKRDKAYLDMYQAGGYTNLSKQLNQMDNCIAQGYNAIILGAISNKGTWAEVRKARRAGIPVIDFVNGITSPDVSAHARVSFYDLAVTTAKYIIKHNKGKTINVGFFPGPEGASWSDQAVRGFDKTIKGTNVHVVVMRRGDTGLNIQLRMIEDSLQAYPNINYIVGVDIAAQAGVIAVRNLHEQGKIKVMAFDIIPPVYNAIKRGAAVGSPTDFTVIQGRMAVDEAVRLLEHKSLLAPLAGPIPKVVTKKTLSSFKWDDMFAPKSFKALYNYKP